VIFSRSATRLSCVVATLVPFGAWAQSVRGVVLQPDSATRAPGIVVIATDERGDAVSRALSGSDGSFEVRLPGAGRYGLRLLRVGYRPTLLPALDVPATGVDGLRAVLNAEAVMLAAVTVRSENVCGTTEDAGQVVARLWEEARTALSAAELSVGARALDVEWQAFQFIMDRGATRAQDQGVLPRRGATERPFVSVSPEILARDGYVVQEGTDRIYNAPDAGALLSDQFAATHCFRVDPPTIARSQWIGIAFRPTPARSRMRDIAGTLWLDRATSELRMLEFRYTNLPPDADDERVGGYVEYVRLRTGHWLVARWAIRMPRTVRRTIGGAAIPGGGRDDRNVLVGLGVTGGELLRVRLGDAVLYQADSLLVSAEGSASTRPAVPSECGAALRPGLTLTGTVSNGPTRAAGAAVTVEWDGGALPGPVKLTTVTDPRGTFLLPCAPVGLPLNLFVVAGTVRAGPFALGPLDRKSTLIDIDIAPPGALK
jgi:hypothetical protein